MALEVPSNCSKGARLVTWIHRGAGAGFLLQALVPLLESAGPLAAPLGLDWVSGSPDNAWTATAVGLSLLAFAFHWLAGDHCTANVLLGGGLLVAASVGSLREEGKAVAGQSVSLVASVTILIVSIFTGNGYGIVGSLLAGTAGLLAGDKRPRMPWKGDVLRCLVAAANLAWRWALRVQHRELEQGSAGGLAEALD
ncbi:transmembrane protein 276 isoform X3 [Paroedura picta]|uniref:transmembrane protein 276 isoform X3 n=1 Tax=Paroedura picta TaxID=143630 RepID=UPI004057CBF0